MAQFGNIVLTDKGVALNAKVGNGVTLNLTKISTSSTEYQASALHALESIDIQQSSNISSKTVINNTDVKLSVVFSNSDLNTGYYIKTLGLYANDPDVGEILYAVCQETSGNCHLPTASDTSSALNIDMVLTTSNSANVTVEVNPAGVVTQSQFNDTVNKKMEWCGTYNSSNNYKNNDVIIYNDAYYKVNEQFTGNMDYSKVTFLGIKSKYDHFTMEIDGNNNANPSVENSCIKYRGGCENFSKQDWVDWFGYKPCIMYSQGEIECYLDPNNYSEDVNGNDVDITTVSSEPRNVMIQHKRIGIMSINISQGKWIIRCTNDPCDGRYSYSAFENGARDCKNIYLGAYNGMISDSKLHSLSNATISVDGQSVSSYRTLAQANGMNYQIMNIKMFSFLRHLFIIQNGTLDGRLSSGFDTANKTSGATNEMGLNISDLTSKWGKWIGMETNCFSEYVDGSYVDSSFRLLIAENDNFNDTGSGYKDCGRIYSLGDGYMGANVTFSPELGFIPNNTNGTSNTLFHSKTLAIKPSTSMVNYGYNIFYNHYTMTPAAKGAGITARLCYMSY